MGWRYCSRSYQRGLKSWSVTYVRTKWRHCHAVFRRARTITHCNEVREGMNAYMY